MVTLPKGWIDDLGRPMGLHIDMPEAEYHAIDAFSYSGSKEFAKSPAHFQAYQKKTWEIDPDREKYKAVHLLCLEPELQGRLKIVDGVWRDKVKAEVQALQQAGNIVLKTDARNDAQAIADAILEHSLAGPILKKSLAEVSIFWVEAGVYCKARIDILSVLPQGVVLGDLKNFGSLANEHLIGSQVARNFYHHQMAWYSRAIEVTFGEQPIARYWIFVEDKKPHGVKIRNCNDAMAESGWASISALLPRYKECKEDDVWPNYAEDEQDVELPHYAFSSTDGGEL